MCWPICKKCEEKLTRNGWCLKCKVKDDRFDEVEK